MSDFERHVQSACTETEERARKRLELERLREQAFAIARLQQALFPGIHLALLHKVPFWLMPFISKKWLAEKASTLALTTATDQFLYSRRFVGSAVEEFPCQCPDCVAKREAEES